MLNTKLALVAWLGGVSAANPWVSKLKGLAVEAVELRRRRDDEVSGVSAVSLVSGLVLLVEPQRTVLGWTEEGNAGTAMFESTVSMVVLFKYYEALLGRLAGVETRLVNGEPRSDRARKRAATAALCCVAVWPLWRSVAAPLCLGMAAARSATAVVDFVATTLSQELSAARATRAVVQPSADADAAYVVAAREAVRREVRKRGTWTQLEAPPAVTAALALSTSVVASRLGSSKTVMAPSVVGAFEVSRASKRLWETNQFLVRTAKLKLATALASALRRPALLVVDVAGAALNAISRASAAVAGLFDTYFFHFLRATPLVKGLRALRIFETRSRRAANAFNDVVKRIQTDLKHFLRDNHDALWPWAVALAGHRCRQGEIAVTQIPAYLGKLAALPTLVVARSAAALLDRARQLAVHAGQTLVRRVSPKREKV